jgi:hypothetical protein
MAWRLSGKRPSDHRERRSRRILYAFADCRIQTIVDTHGAPFVFDMRNLRDNGTGAGCAYLGDGPKLVALQALLQNDQWTIRRTAVDLSGTIASISRSDTVRR